jgi:hypothetical protein
LVGQKNNFAREKAQQSTPEGADSMPANMFEVLRQRREQAAADEQARYRDLIQQLADGAEVDPDEAAKIFEAAGKDLGDAEEDVAKLVKAKPPELPPLPSPVELFAKHVRHDQIARIWGMYDDRGYGRFDLVQRELDEPGSILTPEYVAHWNACRMAAAGFGERPAPWVFPPQPGTAGVPATVTDLLIQRVNAEQIIRMLSAEAAAGLTVEKLRAMAADLGIGFYANAQDALNKGGEAQLRQKAEEFHLDGQKIIDAPLPAIHVLQSREIGSEVDSDSSDPAADEQPIDELVTDLFAAGHDAAAIAVHTGLPKRKVERMIARSYAELENR